MFVISSSNSSPGKNVEPGDLIKSVCYNFSDNSDFGFEFVF